MHPFEPRTFLKQISPALLRQYFAQRGELLDLPWDELPEQRVCDIIFHSWQNLPQPQCQQVHATFHALWEMSHEDGIRALLAELLQHAPQRSLEFAACHTRLNKALWTFLHFPRLFDQAALFVRADAWSRSRYAVRRNSLPKKTLNVTPQLRESLANALRDYYWPQEMRGRHCRVEHHTRQDGQEYFFAYLDNWPDARLVCEDSGAFTSISQREAFSVMFAFCPQDGTLELVTRGKKEVHYPLQRAFSQAVFGIDVDPADPLRPAYSLQQLLDPDFTYPTETTDRIARVRLSRIRLVPHKGTGCPASLEIAFEPQVLRPHWLNIIQRQITALSLTPDKVIVQHAAFQLFFLKSGLERTRTATFSVSLPSYCDLKTKTDDIREMGERCLRRWEVSHD